MADEPLSDAELDQLETLASAASPGPWTCLAGPGLGGPEFIRLGDDDHTPDMYVQHDGEPAPVADLDFIAAARNFIPRLIAEVRRQRGA